MNKAIKCMLVLLCSALIFSNVAYANTEVQKQNVTTIGYIENYATIQSDHVVGDEGYGYEYFEKLSEYTEHKYEYILCENWQQGLQMLKDGELDIFGPMGKTEERDNLFALTERPFGNAEILLSTLKSSEILFDDFNAINNSSVGVVSGTSHLPFLEKYLIENNISVTYSTYTDPNGLDNGVYDLELIGSFYFQENRQTVARLGIEPFYFATNKKDTKLLEEINRAFEELQHDNPFFEQKIYQKYFGNTDLAAPTLTKADQLLLDEKDNSFTVAYAVNHIPLQYMDEDGNANGLSVDVMNLIAEDSGIEFTFIPCNEANKDDIDICICINIHEEDHSLADFEFIETDSYYNITMMMVGKSVSSLEEMGNIGMLDYLFYDSKDANIIRYKKLSFNDVIDSLVQGDIDFIISTNIGIDYVLAKVYKNDFSVYPADGYLPFLMLLSTELDEHVDVFNKFIARLDNKKIDSIVIKHSSGFLPDKTFRHLLDDNLPIVMLAIFIIAIIGFAMHMTKNRSLYKIINTDELTGLISIRKYSEEVKKLLETAKPKEYLLVSVDIDNFQYINEAYGYAYGSRMLKELSKQFTMCFDKEALITREKDDTFLILIKNKLINKTLCGKENCNDCTDTISRILGSGYKISLSRGIYVINNPTENLEYMIDCTHSARRLGKKNYGNTFIEFTESMRKKREDTNKIVSTMEKALVTKEFKIFYQPKINLKTLQLAGAEALVRWLPPDGNMIYPDNFIPLFESNGFIVKLDYYVFEEVCNFIHDYQDKLNRPKISVNLSGITLLGDKLLEKLTHITRKYKLDNHLLEFEITESAIIENLEEAIKKIELLRTVGFAVSMDDFGSGISSLNRLKDINIDILKIDRDFLAGNLSDKKGISIIKNIIKMSKELNLITVAEGVETKEHVEFLQTLECDIAQGYYFARPMTDDDFKTLIKKG